MAVPHKDPVCVLYITSVIYFHWVISGYKAFHFVRGGLVAVENKRVVEQAVPSVSSVYEQAIVTGHARN